MKIISGLILVLLMSACADQTGEEQVEKSSIRSAGLDVPSTSARCESMGAPEDCDPCEVAGWYGDGACDEDICSGTDPDCEDDRTAAMQRDMEPPTDGDAPPVDEDVPPTDGDVPPMDSDVPPMDSDVPPVGDDVPPPMDDDMPPPRDIANPPTNRHQLCGGLVGARCEAKGEYCNYGKFARCGFADASGICTPRPDACKAEFSPVCGCDGRTYSNACMAAVAGISVDASGRCARR